MSSRSGPRTKRARTDEEYEDNANVPRDRDVLGVKDNDVLALVASGKKNLAHDLYTLEEDASGNLFQAKAQFETALANAREEDALQAKKKEERDKILLGWHQQIESLVTIQNGLKSPADLPSSAYTCMLAKALVNTVNFKMDSKLTIQSKCGLSNFSDLDGMEPLVVNAFLALLVDKGIADTPDWERVMDSEEIPVWNDRYKCRKGIHRPTKFGKNYTNQTNFLMLARYLGLALDDERFESCKEAGMKINPVRNQAAANPSDCWSAHKPPPIIHNTPIKTTGGPQSATRQSPWSNPHAVWHGGAPSLPQNAVSAGQASFNSKLQDASDDPMMI